MMTSDYQKRLKEAKKRREKMFRLRDKGFTFQEIGDVFGISKQFVHQLFRRYGKIPTKNVE